MKVAIIDYGMGNTGSVVNALKFLKTDSLITKDQKEIADASHIILPGVGAFADGMKRLRNSGLVEMLEKEVIERKKPYLGICLGMQFLAEVGEEGGEHKGLGWIKGTTRRFQIDEKKFPVPHIGWNDVVPQKESTLLKDTEPTIFYFVHSYFLDPKEDAIISQCEYGEPFAAAIEKGNIFGTQFHPEKSQKSGIKVLENFLQYA